MKKLLLLAIFIGSGAWANLPKPKQSCNILDLQARYARLYAAGSFCGKDENSEYANNLNILYLRDQKRCNVSSEQIDPNDKQIDSAYSELNNLQKNEQKFLCSSIDTQIKSLVVFQKVC